MSTLNDTFSDREVQQLWDWSIQQWAWDQARDEECQAMREETKRRTRVDARYPFKMPGETQHEASLRRIQAEGDDWDDYGYGEDMR